MRARPTVVRARRRAALALALLTLALHGVTRPATAQERAATVRQRPTVTARAALELAPAPVRAVVVAADSILISGDVDRVSLESFNAGIATGVYLYGSLNGQLESVGYGEDVAARHYLWLSIQARDSVEYLAMLYDVGSDLSADFLLFRTVDRVNRVESSTEYRAPSVRDVPFDITIQPACVPPRCDPAAWTVQQRTRVDVPEFWFEMWRPVLTLAAMRGERWLGRPMAALPTGPPRP